MVEVERARAGVGGLPAEDAVELDGVADGLVDLQRHLLGPRISVAPPLGHGGADSSALASSATRVARA